MHIRCPHCQHAVEVVGTQEFASVICPSCGSSFDLLPETTSFWLSKRKIGHFELLDQLGTGGFGSVWKARDTKLDRLVAIKVPRVDHSDPEHAELFLREARAAAQLRHPQIVAVHEVGREDGTLYIVSDFVQGVTLADRLTAGPFPPREAAELAAQIADALHHAHEAGVIHRDLKPSNIMLDAAGLPQLMDFGLAKRDAGEITMTIDGKVLGTPAYMSPEQARGEGHRVDRRTDIYSLGVILFELLTGERPFRGNQRMLLHQVIHDDPPSPRKLNSRVPRDLETICLQCLEREPSKRYATGQDVADEFRRHLQGQPIRARPVSRIERTWRWARRNPTIAGLATAVVATLVVGSAASSYFAVLESREAKRALTASSRAFHYYYLAQMNLAQRDWDANDVSNVLERLAKTKPTFTGGEDFRRFEWHYWDRLTHGELRTFTIESTAGTLPPIAFNLDATRIVSADGFDVRVWDVSSGKPVKKLAGHTQPVLCAAFSPDGAQIASGDLHGTLKVWDSDTGTALRTIKAHDEAVHGVAFNSNNSRIVSASVDGTPKVWDVATGNELLALVGHCGEVFCVAFSHDGTRIVSGSEDTTLKLWDAVTGAELKTLAGHGGIVEAVTFNHDGTRIVSGSHDRSVRIWDAVTGAELLVRKANAKAVNAVAFSQDGARLVSGGGDETVRIWDAITGDELLTLKGHTSGVGAVAFNADGTRITSVSYETPDNAKIWDADSDQEVLILKAHTKAVTSVAFSPDGRRIVSGSSDQTVIIWDWATGNPVTLNGHTSGVASVGFSADGTRIVSVGWDGPENAKVWDTHTGLLQITFSLSLGTDAFHRVALSPDATRIIVGGRDGTLAAWNAFTGEEVFRLKEHDYPVSEIAMSRDGSRIITINGLTATVRDSATGHKLVTRTLNSSPVTIATNCDGTRILGYTVGRGLAVWDVQTGKELMSLSGSMGLWGTSAFSPDAARIVNGSIFGSMKLWDVDASHDLLTLKGHNDAVCSVAFNADGSRLAAGTRDGTIKMWDGSPRLIANRMQ